SGHPAPCRGESDASRSRLAAIPHGRAALLCAASASLRRTSTGGRCTGCRPGGGPAVTHHLHSTITQPREELTVTPIASATAEVGHGLWAMEEARRGLLRTITGLDQDALDWRGRDGSDNSIGSLLYH